MKAYWKRFIFLNNLNAHIKAYLQEYEAKRGQKYYLKRAKNRQCYLLSKTELFMALRERLVAKGVQPEVKSKGNLNIFLTFALNNWEQILPVAVEPFGRVTVFEWRSLGFDDGAPNWLQYRDRMNAEMLKSFSKANLEKPLDVVIGYLSGYYIDPEVLHQMGKAGAVIFNFCWDDKFNFPGPVVGGRYTSTAAIAPVVDLNLTNSRDSILKYAVHGGLAMFWPEAAHQDFHKPYPVQFEYDVSFVGGKYGWRPNFIAKLRELGIEVACFGDGWEKGTLSYEEMVELYSRSRINLGFAGVGHSKNLMCLKGRDFEVPMSGGLYLTQDNPELSFVYDIGKEIVTYKNEIDCAEKIKWLLANPVEADNIRRAGRMRALRCHTWEERFKEIFSMAGLLSVSEKGAE